MCTGENNYDNLILRIKNKERDALECLYKSLKSLVYGLALAILKNHDDASDVMQNVFIKVWQTASQYRQGTDAKAWIFKITRNLALYQLRGQKHTTGIDEYAGEIFTDDKVSPTLDKLMLQGLLSNLDKNERQIIILYSIWGYSHKEIAKIMGKPYATIRWRFSNSINKLSKLVEENCYD
jgi:RNA polymerase sigma-70 factor (ECF subfamily)